MNPTDRFSQTVDDYIRYRPSYPTEIVKVLINECNLTQQSIIADIGSGTGLLTRLFLDNGNTVYGVEPNDAMRAAGEDYLSSFSSFHSIKGTAEATTLPPNSINIILAGTSFHWFDASKSKQEFKRILKHPGWVVLIWNVRDMNSPLISDYENLIIKFGKDY